ncbi:MAG: outer membrane protein assembly factor BamE, partial [Alphaproteobacteria bacterium]|nr:outer membrane protein assembly factor BamE [Alphaproteobacteria bacterium]
MRWSIRNGAMIGTIVLAAACAPIVDIHGFIPDNELLDRVKVGEFTRAQLTELLGAPSSVAQFDGETWYYISRRTEAIAFLKPKIVDQRVVGVSFSKDTGVVTEVKRFEIDDAREIALVERETPTH